MTLFMSGSGVLAVLLCHFIVAGSVANITDFLWYLPFIPLFVFFNWFVAGFILIPLRQLLQATTKLANMDIRQRLEVELN